MRTIRGNVLAGLNMAPRQYDAPDLSPHTALDRAAQIHAEYITRFQSATATSKGHLTFEQLVRGEGYEPDHFK